MIFLLTFQHHNVKKITRQTMIKKGIKIHWIQHFVLKWNFNLFWKKYTKWFPVSEYQTSQALKLINVTFRIALKKITLERTSAFVILSTKIPKVIISKKILYLFSFCYYFTLTNACSNETNCHYRWLETG